MAFFKRRSPPEPVAKAADAKDDAATDLAATSEKPELSAIATLIVADLAVRAGDRLVRRGIERGLLGGKPAQTGRVIRGRTLKETVIGTVLAEIARRSVPGAIVVGGGLIAQALRDRRRARQRNQD